jgi:yecA family protein
MLDFDAVQQSLEGLGATVDAAESHGTLTALLIANDSMAGWLSHTLDDLPDKSDVLASERLSLLNELFNETREQLNNEELGFELLLPDESDDFGVQLLGLSSWCQGFLYGYGVNAAGFEQSVDEPAQECLSDLLEISKLRHDEELNDEAELQFAEIAEHVRMAILLLNESLNPITPAATIH